MKKLLSIMKCLAIYSEKVVDYSFSESLLPYQSV